MAVIPETAAPGAGAVSDTLGEVVSGAPPTGVVMSLRISLWFRGRLYIRTSSMRPLKYSPQIESPPMRRALLDVVILPPPTWLLARLPFIEQSQFEPCSVEHTKYRRVWGNPE